MNLFAISIVSPISKYMLETDQIRCCCSDFKNFGTNIEATPNIFLFDSLSKGNTFDF